MSGTLKALTVVLVVATLTFRLARPIAVLFSAEADFSRRRNVWLILTATAFLTPSFWLFVVVAVPLLIRGGRKDANPIAFYLLMFNVVPQIPVEIPTIGIQSLFPLEIYRLLSLCVLIPAVAHVRQLQNGNQIRRLDAMDWMLLLYIALQLILFVPTGPPGHMVLNESATGTLRRAFLNVLDIYVLYFAVSRLCTNRRAIAEAMAAFCLGCAILASLAVFESVRHWLLFANLIQRWSEVPVGGLYLLRAGVLRAQVTAGHSIALGFLLSIAIGFWLYLQSHVRSALVRIAVLLLLTLGLIASWSRGPWLGAIVISLAFATLGPRPVSRLSRSLGVIGLCAALLGVTQLGERVASVVPFLGGSVDIESVTYRQRLAAKSWELIRENPILGDQHALLKMEDLRQGEGIIDVVNTLAGVALLYGVIGLLLFLSPSLLGFLRARRFTKSVMQSDPDLALLGASLGACIIGLLVMIATVSFIFGIEKMYYVLAGLAAAYAAQRVTAEHRWVQKLPPSKMSSDHSGRAGEYKGTFCRESC